MRIAPPFIAGLLALTGALAPRSAAAQDQVAVASPPRAEQDCSRVPDPPMRAVRGTTLTMAPATYSVGGTQYESNVYNGNFLGPTLTIEPGQRVELAVRNAMR